jgi:hypothetical protein
VSVLERKIGSQIQVYLERRAAFNRRRRKIKADFDKLYKLFASDLSFHKIAERVGVTRPRLNEIFRLHFQDLFPVSGLERQRQRRTLRRNEIMNRVARLISEDPVLNSIKASAAKGRRKRLIEPILLARRGEPTKRYRHKAVLVDGKHVEPVHHIRKPRVFARGGLAYGTTSLSRHRLEESTWTIFVVDVPHYRRRVLRSKSAKLLKALFDGKAQKKSTYIPLNGRPEDPVYDFLADEDNWS